MARISLNIPDKEEEKVISSLETLGLHRNEIFIYLDLLKYPEASALDISKRTGIHRSNTYDALRSLNEKGFIEEKINENKKSFIALDPENLKGFMKEKQQELKSSIQTLKRSSNEEKLEEGILVIKGAITLREEIQSLIEKKQGILIEGADQKTLELLTEEFLKSLKEDTTKEEIPFKIIRVCEKGDCETLSGIKNLNTRYLKEDDLRETATIICDDVVMHLLYKNPPEAIKIKNKGIAQAHAKDFNVLWENADKKK